MTETWTPEPDLEALVQKAEADGLWLHCSYQDLWFSPAELRAEWNRGRFQWGAVNWELRNPAEHLEHLTAQEAQVWDERARLAARIAKAHGEAQEVAS